MLQFGNRKKLNAVFIKFAEINISCAEGEKHEKPSDANCNLFNWVDFAIFDWVINSKSKNCEISLRNSKIQRLHNCVADILT